MQLGRNGQPMIWGVGGMVIAMYLPIFKLGQVVG